jgi:hypothetical protein
VKIKRQFFLCPFLMGVLIFFLLALVGCEFKNPLSAFDLTTQNHKDQSDNEVVVDDRYHNIDPDFIEWKERYESPKAWLIEQAYHSKEVLLALQSESYSNYELSPTISNHRCFSCHQDLSREVWKERSRNGKIVMHRLNISSLNIILRILQSLDWPQASALSRDLSLLHDAHLKGLDRALLRRMVSILEDEILHYFLSLEYTKERYDLLLGTLVNYCAENEFLPFVFAEQCTVGIFLLTDHIDTPRNTYKKQLLNLYDSVRNENEFQSEEFTKAAVILRKSLIQ